MNEAPLTDDAFGTLMSAMDSPLVVVTAAEGEERAGCLVGFHVQSSIEPPRYCLWLSKANHTYRVALRASHLAVHFLTADDLPLAELFGTQTGDTVDKFVGLAVDTGPGGAPVLRQCASWLTARRIALLDAGGDHVCLVTETVAAHAEGPFQPLRLSAAAHLEPGHGSEERPEPPTERAVLSRSLCFPRSPPGRRSPPSSLVARRKLLAPQSRHRCPLWLAGVPGLGLLTGGGLSMGLLDRPGRDVY
jgi:flavin reductase (DIM6/NTAB) family NADH-FMN oxidoreductase RutF